MGRIKGCGLVLGALDADKQQTEKRGIEIRKKWMANEEDIANTMIMVSMCVIQDAKFPFYRKNDARISYGEVIVIMIFMICVWSTRMAMKCRFDILDTS